MSAPKDLHEVFVNDLKDLYSAGRRLNHTLQQMVDAATCPELKTSLQEQLDENEVHLLRLDYIAGHLHLELDGAQCPALDDLVATDPQGFAPGEDPGAADTRLICLAQKIEYHVATGYTAVRSHAQLLGYASIAEILALTLDEQVFATKRLVHLAASLGVEAAA